MTGVETPHERCGYTIEPHPTYSGSFNPVTGALRISRDGAHAVFPARLYPDVAACDDDTFLRVMNSLFFMPDDWSPPTADTLVAHVLSTQVVVPRALVEDGEALAEIVRERLAQPLPPPPTEAELEAMRERREAERAGTLAALQAEWQQLREQLRDSPVVLAVLDVHEPDDYDIGACTHPVLGYEADTEPWPCTTIKAIRQAPR